MKPAKWIFLWLLALALTSCATATNVPDGTAVRANQGLLVFHVTTPFMHGQLQFTDFSTKSSFGYFLAQEFTGPDGAFQLAPGSEYWVKPVKAGDYMWSQLVVGDRYAIFHGSNRFTIKPGTITYVGHLAIQERGGQVRIGVRDDEADIRAYLAEHFPHYLQTMPLEKSVTDFAIGEPGTVHH